MEGAAASHVRLQGGDAETVSASFQDMRRRGLCYPLQVVSNGAPGIIKAIEACFSRSVRQRCLAHRMRNLVAKGLLAENLGKPSL